MGGRPDANLMIIKSNQVFTFKKGVWMKDNNNNRSLWYVPVDDLPLENEAGQKSDYRTPNPQDIPWEW